MHAGARVARSIDGLERHEPGPFAEAIQGRTDVGPLRPISLEEERFERSGSLEHLPENDEQRGEVVRPDPPVSAAGQPGTVAGHVERPHERGGRRPHRTEHPIDRREHAGDPAEGQARGDEPGDLPIRGVVVRTDPLDGIRDLPGPIETGVQPIQRPPQVHRRSPETSHPTRSSMAEDGSGAGAFRTECRASGQVPTPDCHTPRNVRVGTQKAVTGTPWRQSGQPATG